MIRKRVVITGEVQGVYYRDTCRRVARAAGVAGWVRNRPDRSVEAVFEGPAEAVADLVGWTRVGPELAIVDRVDVHDEPVEGLTGFDIRPTG
ncbi:acylphosphatase [Catellatospora sp. TT07R-123]|uniref:acylphosphatase n=1 Tax=Catellatospora sp. TT07R-123 TaxID=2733863 RepID=UPI001B2B4D5A|nr:acylphosphatase [Catellatospora sp. TT07R-123]GHJ49478.1 acylphosphatase [Catellatospora sp. TT07R-123]